MSKKDLEDRIKKALEPQYQSEGSLGESGEAILQKHRFSYRNSSIENGKFSGLSVEERKEKRNSLKKERDAKIHLIKSIAEIEKEIEELDELEDKEKTNHSNRPHSQNGVWGFWGFLGGIVLLLMMFASL